VALVSCGLTYARTMALWMWRVYCLGSGESARSLFEVGTYQHGDPQELKSTNVIEINHESYRIVFFVHTGPRQSGGNLVVVPAT
jgi:hypothetical protein